LIRQTIKVPSSSRQVAFHQLLVAARKTWLRGALSDILGRVDPNALKMQLSAYVPTDAQQTTNSWFDVAQMLGRNGEDWEEFRSRFAGEVGIPMS
jgi:hypothetical protein